MTDQTPEPARADAVVDWEGAFHALVRLADSDEWANDDSEGRSVTAFMVASRFTSNPAPPPAGGASAYNQLLARFNEATDGWAAEKRRCAALEAENERLAGEVDAMAEDYQRAAREHGDCDAETARLRAESARRLALLKEVEWTDGGGFCPFCEGNRGHAPGCRLAAELAKEDD